jgi:anti-anti-sigma regulatory factor
MANTILNVQQTEKGVTMIYEGEFTVTNAHVIKEFLVQSVARESDEILSLFAATSIDASGIQLAFSWKKVLQSQGRKADVLLPQSEEIKDLLEKTGISQIL